MIEYGHDKKQKLGEILDNHNHVYIFWRNLENLHNQIGNILEKFLLQQISAILRNNPLCVTQKTPIEPTLGGMGSALRWVILESIY